MLFVARTKNGELADLLRKKEEEINKFSKQKVKIIERNGKRIEHILCKSDPWKDELCSRHDCFMCKTAEKEVGHCRKQNITYKITCKLCKSKGSKVEYWGESSRAGYLRGREHYRDLETLSEASHMARHLRTQHPDVNLQEVTNRAAEKWFIMELDSQYTSAMDRQLSEALAIARAGGMDSPGVMNSADEYNRCILPELQSSSEIKAKEREKRQREEETIEKPQKRARREPPPPPRTPYPGWSNRSHTCTTG